MVYFVGSANSRGGTNTETVLAVVYQEIMLRPETKIKEITKAAVYDPDRMD